jgi:hypothetical protein
MIRLSCLPPTQEPEPTHANNTCTHGYHLDDSFGLFLLWSFVAPRHFTVMVDLSAAHIDVSLYSDMFYTLIWFPMVQLKASMALRAVTHQPAENTPRKTCVYA